MLLVIPENLEINVAYKYVKYFMFTFSRKFYCFLLDLIHNYLGKVSNWCIFEVYITYMYVLYMCGWTYILDSKKSYEYTDFTIMSGFVFVYTS